jgi:excisionase family DNA binding protein
MSDIITKNAPLERLTYSVEEAAKRLGISRNSAYEGVNNGTIPCIVIGRRKLVPRAALGKMLSGE